MAQHSVTFTAVSLKAILVPLETFRRTKATNARVRLLPHKRTSLPLNADTDMRVLPRNVLLPTPNVRSQQHVNILRRAPYDGQVAIGQYYFCFAVLFCAVAYRCRSCITKLSPGSTRYTILTRSICEEIGSIMKHSSGAPVYVGDVA